MSAPDLAHAMLMDDVYRWQRHIYDLTRKFYLLGRDRLINELQPPAGGSVLEVGCGTGRNLISVATRYLDAQCHGFDLSAQMLTTALRSSTRAGVSTRIMLARGDATDFSADSMFGRETFDRVFISYALSMIPDWQAAIEQAMNCVAPGGRLHIVDFGQQEGMPALFRHGLFAWLEKFHVSPRADLFDVMTDIAARHDGRVQAMKLYRDYARYSIITRG